MSPIVDGQAVNASVTNAAFLYKNTNDTSTGSLTLAGLTLTGLTAFRALVSTAGGGIVVATPTSTEVEYLSGVTSAIQTQINGKQSGPLTGDVTTSGAAATLATVNSTIGSFGSSTAIPGFTVNAKGLITSAGENVVIAPAGTLTGTTLASGVVTSSLTSIGTITTGVWNGTAVDATHGGTAQTSWTLGDLLYSSASNTLAKLAGSTSATMAVLTQTGNGTISAAPAWTTTTGTGSVVRAASPTFSGTVNAAAVTLSGALVTAGTTGVTSGGVATFNGDLNLAFAGANNFVYFQSSNNFVGRTGATGDIGIGWAAGQNLIFTIAGTEQARVSSAGNWITALGAPCTKGYDTSTATSGTITASANKPGLVINSAGGTTLTIQLPSSPIDGQQYFVASVGAFTTITWQDSGGTAGNVIGGQVASGGVNRGQRFVYSAALTKWLSIG